MGDNPDFNRRQTDETFQKEVFPSWHSAWNAHTTGSSRGESQNNSDVFELIRQRIEENRGRIRKMKADYLAYALIDLVVDKYFPVMESVGSQIEAIEDELLEKPSPEIVREIRDIKRGLILIRSSIWPMREVISSLQRGESKLIAEPQLYSSP